MITVCSKKADEESASKAFSDTSIFASDGNVLMSWAKFSRQGLLTNAGTFELATEVNGYKPSTSYRLTRLNIFDQSLDVTLLNQISSVLIVCFDTRVRLAD